MLWDWYAGNALRELTFYLEFGKGTNVDGQTIKYDFDGYQQRALMYADKAAVIADAMMAERKKRFGG